MKKDIKLYLMLHASDWFDIVSDYSFEVKEIKKLEEKMDPALYNHPLANAYFGEVSFDLDSEIAKHLIRYKKTGKLSKKLRDYILNDISEIVKAEEERKKMEMLNVKTKNSEGYIYVVKSNQLYKIGRTKDIEQRMKEFERVNPFKFELIIAKKVNDYIKTEKRLLETFKDKKYKGEWFKLDEKDINWIKENL